MTQAQITERQQYWGDHVLSSAAHDGSIVEYAAANILKINILKIKKPQNLKTKKPKNQKTKNFYQWKTALTTRGFLPLENAESFSDIAEVKFTSTSKPNGEKPVPMAAPLHLDVIDLHTQQVNWLSDGYDLT